MEGVEEVGGVERAVEGWGFDGWVGEERRRRGMNETKRSLLFLFALSSPTISSRQLCRFLYCLVFDHDLNALVVSLLLSQSRTGAREEWGSMRLSSRKREESSERLSKVG